MSAVVTVIEKCPICDKKTRWYYVAVPSEKPRCCSFQCIEEYYWRATLNYDGVAYYPNPATHDKLGRKLGG